MADLFDETTNVELHCHSEGTVCPSAVREPARSRMAPLRPLAA